MCSISLSAHPEYYDYIHYLQMYPTFEKNIQNDPHFLPQKGTCKFVDGGGQQINGIWNGTYEMTEKNINISYNELDHYGTKKTIDPPIRIVINYTSENQLIRYMELGHLCTKYTKKYILDTSPCPCGKDNKQQQTNLFNLLENIHYPLIFYENCSGSLPSNIQDCFKYVKDPIWSVKCQCDYIPIINSVNQEYKQRINDIIDIKEFILQKQDSFIFHDMNINNKDSREELLIYAENDDNNVSDEMYNKIENLPSSIKMLKLYETLED